MTAPGALAGAPGLQARSVLRTLVGSSAAEVVACARSLEGAGWHAVVDAAAPGLHPYLHHRLTSTGALTAAPDAVARRLAQEARAAAVVSLQQRAVLRATVTTLARAGIECVVLKGAALGPTVYPSPLLRPMTDLDLRVPPDRVDDAVAMLRAQGFRSPDARRPDGTLALGIDQRRLCAPDGRTLVELHGVVRSLALLSDARVARCWTRTQPIADLPEARRLAPEDVLLHVTLHLAATDRFAGGQLGLLDLALLVDRWRDQIDWGGVARDARLERVAVYLWVALSVAEAVYGMAVPPPIARSVDASSHQRALLALATEQLWARKMPLPFALEQVLREPTLHGRLGAVVRRLLVHGRTTNAGAPRMRTVSAGLWHDLVVKVPGYLRAWATGDLAGAGFRERARLAAGRGQLGRLVRDAEARLAEPTRDPAS